MFPALPHTNVTFLILSQAFHLHQAKTLLRRLSRICFNMASCADDSTAQFDRFSKKYLTVPLSSN